MHCSGIYQDLVICRTTSHSLLDRQTVKNPLLSILSLSTFLKLNFFLLDLNNNSLKYRTALSLQRYNPLRSQPWFYFRRTPYLLGSNHCTFLLSCYYHIRELRCIHPYLDFKTASTIATSIIHSKLDYCNSLYHNLPNCQLNRFQQIQNYLARAAVKAPKSTHITPILKSLHWLKVNERIEYKFLSLTKFLQLLNL